MFFPLGRSPSPLPTPAGDAKPAAGNRRPAPSRLRDELGQPLGRKAERSAEELSVLAVEKNPVHFTGAVWVSGVVEPVDEGAVQPECVVRRKIGGPAAILVYPFVQRQLPQEADDIGGPGLEPGVVRLGGDGEWLGDERRPGGRL